MANNTQVLDLFSRLGYLYKLVENINLLADRAGLRLNYKCLSDIDWDWNWHLNLKHQSWDCCSKDITMISTSTNSDSVKIVDIARLVQRNCCQTTATLPPFWCSLGTNKIKIKTVVESLQPNYIQEKQLVGLVNK